MGCLPLKSSPGDLASEAEAFRIEVLAKQDDGEYGAVTGGGWKRWKLGKKNAGKIVDLPMKNEIFPWFSRENLNRKPWFLPLNQLGNHHWNQLESLGNHHAIHYGKSSIFLWAIMGHLSRNPVGNAIFYWENDDEPGGCSSSCPF